MSSILALDLLGLIRASLVFGAVIGAGLDEPMPDRTLLQRKKRTGFSN